MVGSWKHEIRRKFIFVMSRKYFAELFLPKVPIWLKQSLEICIVLGGLVKVFECDGSSIVGVE